MKRIMTEVSIDNPIFKVKIGTLNKAYPDTIYIDFGVFVTPLEEKESYKEDESELRKLLLKETRELVKNTDLFSPDFIEIVELASERMKLGKKSYLSIQCYLKPKEVIGIKEQINKMSGFLTDIFNRFCLIITNLDYGMSKTKRGELFIIEND